MELTHASPEHAPKRGLQLAYSAFLLIAIGRVGELIPGLGGLPLARIAMGLALVILFRRRKELPLLSGEAKSLARGAVTLVVMVFLTTPTSIWIGASVAFIYGQLVVLVAAVVVGFKLSGTWSRIRSVARILIVSGLILGLSALRGFHGGRASNDETAYDTNDLAYLLVSLAPIAFAFAITATTKVRRLSNLAVVGVMLVALLLTASRGGFFGLLAVLVALVLLPIRPLDLGVLGSNRRHRAIPTLIGVLCVFGLTWQFLPVETRERLSTVFSISNDYNLDSSNAHSRWSIWERILQPQFTVQSGTAWTRFQWSTCELEVDSWHPITAICRC